METQLQTKLIMMLNIKSWLLSVRLQSDVCALFLLTATLNWLYLASISIFTWEQTLDILKLKYDL